jgi:hypothetical protein
VVLSPLLVVASITLACSGTGQKDDADLRDVKSTLSLFSSLLAKGDTIGLSQLCSPKLVLLEDGKTYSLREMLRSISEILSAGTMTRSIEDVSVEVRGDFAWSHCRVIGEFRTKEEAVPLALLESVVLERIGQKWQIVQVCTMLAAKPAGS